MATQKLIYSFHTGWRGDKNKSCTCECESFTLVFRVVYTDTQEQLCNIIIQLLDN